MVKQDFGALRRRFEAHGQEHVFRFWDRLDEGGRERLLVQARAIDLEAIDRVREHAAQLQQPEARRLEPAPIVRLPEHGGDAAARRRAGERGEALLASGVVAALVVAGGQGTRLGYGGPKGTFPIGPVSGRSLFGIQAQKIRGLRRRHGKPVPWYVMTSPATDAATRAHFAAADYFGLPRADVVFFRQDTAPALDFAGKLLLERPDRIAESPDGHGGTLTALARSRSLADMERRGVTTLSYYQVDNPLVRIGDPVYLGLHAEARAEMSCKVVPKRDPDEKMGVVARIDGRVGVVEYTELDEPCRSARDERGELVYWAGNIAVHLLEVDFVRRVAEDAERLLPYHASAKKIACVDAEGRSVEPHEPNGIKLERFIFDALPAAERLVIAEARREDEYAPVKNASGEDSPASARRALVAQYRRWLEAADITPPRPDEIIEIDHAVIDGPEDARRSDIQDAAAGACIQVAHGASL